MDWVLYTVQALPVCAEVWNFARGSRLVGLILCAYHLSIFEFMLNTFQFFTSEVYLRTGFLLKVSASIEQANLKGSHVGIYTVRGSEFIGSEAVTTLQTAASLLCDIVITLHLARSKTGLPMFVHVECYGTEHLLNGLMINAVNHGFLTAITSTLTVILFLVLPVHRAQ
ncbi:hypothetical protein C8F04DRAFT_1174309 [Mycena alexandri]|uniref:Uncharacterized protein n=1 Tax=Mycena alexandri TaxID=1745969 RepID=A0AAD6THS5_9AGAR|nr:hypothetical protein C8F04DRAFT_1174309 [Mycena alexandri]